MNRGQKYKFYSFYQ